GARASIRRTRPRRGWRMHREAPSYRPWPDRPRRDRAENAARRPRAGAPGELGGAALPGRTAAPFFAVRAIARAGRRAREPAIEALRGSPPARVRGRLGALPGEPPCRSDPQRADHAPL